MSYAAVYITSFPEERFKDLPMELERLNFATGRAEERMFKRCSLILLSGVFCHASLLFAEDLSNLVKKGREAFKSGKFDDAEWYHRLAVEEAERAGDIAREAEALGDLGGVLLAKGRQAEAKIVCLKALGMLRNALSKRYLPVVLNNLGALSSGSGEFVQAESYLLEALRVIDEINPRDPYRVRVLNNLGVLHYATKNYNHAERNFRQAIDLERDHGTNSSELVPLLVNLGGVYVAEKKWDAAGQLFDRALALLKDSPGFDHASVFDSIGTMHAARGQHREAQEFFRRSHRIRLEKFGKGHPAVASSAANLASTLSATGEYMEAEDLLKDALAVYEKTFGSESLQVLATLESLTEVFRKTSREEDAVLVEERARDIRFVREHVVPANALR
jgi:tetratricopeptide (TPR) repeat protein